MFSASAMFLELLSYKYGWMFLKALIMFVFKKATTDLFC